MALARQAFLAWWNDIERIRERALVQFEPGNKNQRRSVS
jgi:hypothetical protein